jgi:hypothetical protein
MTIEQKIETVRSAIARIVERPQGHGRRVAIKEFSAQWKNVAAILGEESGHEKLRTLRAPLVRG